MTKFKLSDTLNIPLKDAESLISAYFKAFPKIKGFLDALANYGKAYGHIKTFAPFRRIRWFEDWHLAKDDPHSSLGFKILGSIDRASRNSPIQGCGADMVKLALAYIHAYIMDNNYPVKLIAQFHDEVLTEVQEDKAEEWARIKIGLMKKAGGDIIKNIPMEAEYSISKEWRK
jgi:DNA polymerase I